MRILGICFAGTATRQRDEMATFMSSVMGAPRASVQGTEADMFLLPDGTAFAVASPRGMGETDRSIGFLVEDLDEALSELRAHGVHTDAEPSTNELYRYVHFVAPDGCLYELVERRGATSASNCSSVRSTSDPSGN